MQAQRMKPKYHNGRRLCVSCRRALQLVRGADG
ncbi:MAG: hypothetical protein KAS72_02500 [Phycisphaerales bacterium]|nr:hypothetical protein [Phycisphaerales bacterium]